MANIKKYSGVGGRVLLAAFIDSRTTAVANAEVGPTDLLKRGPNVIRVHWASIGEVAPEGLDEFVTALADLKRAAEEELQKMGGQAADPPDAATFGASLMGRPAPGVTTDERLAAADSVAAHAADLIRRAPREGTFGAAVAARRQTLLRAEWDEFWHYLSLHARLPDGGSAPADGWFYEVTEGSDAADGAPAQARLEVPHALLMWQGGGAVPTVDDVVLPDEAALGPAAFALDLGEAVRRWLEVRETECVVLRVNRRDAEHVRAAVRGLGFDVTVVRGMTARTEVGP